MRHLISLGYRCDVAFQLRMHSGENVSHFLDWLVTPATGLVDVLRRDFEVFAPDHLEPEHESGHPQVMDKATGIRFLHHFATYEGKIPTSFLSVYPEFIAKFRYMAARFRDYSQNKACTFVRWRIDEKQARLVEEAFFERFPKADARFLYVNPTGKTFVTDHGHSRQLPNNNFTMGDPIAWAELLLDEGLVTHPYRLSVLDILGTGHDNYNMSANNRFTVEHMQAAIAANPEKADYHYELARIYRKTDPIAAERALDQTLALDPGNLIYQALKVTFLKGANQLDGQDYINALTSCLMPSDGNGVLRHLPRLTCTHEIFVRPLFILTNIWKTVQQTPRYIMTRPWPCVTAETTFWRNWLSISVCASCRKRPGHIF